MSIWQRLGGGALPPALRALSRRVGLAQVVLSTDAVDLALEQPELTVPYGPRSALLGLERFPLALDEPAHERARDLIEVAIAESAGAHRTGVDQARQTARRAVDRSGAHLDAVRDVIDPALADWVDDWFGLQAQGPELLRTSRMITHAMFFNPSLPNGATDELGLARAAAWVDAHRRALTELVPSAAKRPEGSLTARLFLRTGEDADLTARHLLGLTVGPLALGSQAIANALEHLLRRPGGLDEIAAAADPEATARARFLEALRVAPPLPGVMRTCPHDVSVRRPGHPSSFDLPPGRVLVLTQVAMRGPAASTDLDRHLAFGHGDHRCLGPAQITEVAGTILAALARRSPRPSPGPRGRISAGPAPSAIEHWPFAGHLEVTFEE